MLLFFKEKEIWESKVYKDIDVMVILIFVDIKCGFVKNGSYKDR